MDIFHELLEIKDIVEGPAKGGAGEGEPHRVEGAVQDDPVHLLIKDDISHFDHFISTSNCQSIVIKLMNFPTLLITTQNSNSLNQMS